MSTYQSISETLKTAANSVNASGFNIHAQESDANLNYHEQYPQIKILEIRDNPNRIAHTNSWNILVAVVGEDDPASNPDSENTDDTNVVNQEDLIREMWTLKEAFMNALVDANVQISGETSRRSLRNMMATESGWYIQFTINTKLSC